MLKPNELAVMEDKKINKYLGRNGSIYSFNKSIIEDTNYFAHDYCTWNTKRDAFHESVDKLYPKLKISCPAKSLALAFSVS